MRKITITLLAMMSCLIAMGQTRHFYTSEKLSSNMITCITQDKAGYIWIGTEYGLNKYDGYRFTNHLHDAGNNSTINSNNITSLFTDDRGNLWVGTGAGLAFYDDANNRFERIALPIERVPRINDIIKEDGQHLLIGTSGYGLFRLNITT